MGQWPPLLKTPKVELLSSDRVDDITRQRVRIEVAPGRLTNDAYLLTPAGKGPFPAVVVVYYESLTGVGLGKNPLRDFALRLARRGFVTLSVGSPPESYYPDKAHAQVQPLSYHAYVAANCHTILAQQPNVDAQQIGIVGHSYGGKWAMFASCLYDQFAAAAWSDGGIVFDERRPNVNYWEPWYLGYEPGRERKRGVLTSQSPRTGPYKRMIAEGRDLHELHALMAPRPFLVSGGAEDQPERWAALIHTVEVNKLLGHEGRVGMTNRPTHAPTEESNLQIDTFFERFLKPAP
ncbi:MAG: S9 family peptidase [Bacteroidales bacterium]|nr:S9 family peptidase [Bacteroidales bacterium]